MQKTAVKKEHGTYDFTTWFNCQFQWETRCLRSCMGSEKTRNNCFRKLHFWENILYSVSKNLSVTILFLKNICILLNKSLQCFLQINKLFTWGKQVAIVIRPYETDRQDKQLSQWLEWQHHRRHHTNFLLNLQHEFWNVSCYNGLTNAS